MTVDGVQQNGYTLDADGVTVQLRAAPRNGGTVVVTYKIQNLAKQVLVSSDSINFFDGILLTFTSANWAAKAGEVYRPRDQQLYDHRWRRHPRLPGARPLDRALIQGPRRSKVARPSGVASIPPPVLYTAGNETDPNEFVPPFNPNLLASETQQVDTLAVLSTDNLRAVNAAS